MQSQMPAPAGDLGIPGAMRAVCLPLLLSLLCSRRALGLQCYSCSGLQNSVHCQPDACPEGSVCFKAMLGVARGHGGGHEVTMEYRGCAPSCEAVSQNFQSLPWGPEPDITMEGLEPHKPELQHVNCCAQNLCNKPGLGGRPRGPPRGRCCWPWHWPCPGPCCEHPTRRPGRLELSSPRGQGTGTAPPAAQRTDVTPHSGTHTHTHTRPHGPADTGPARTVRPEGKPGAGPGSRHLPAGTPLGPHLLQTLWVTPPNTAAQAPLTCLETAALPPGLARECPSVSGGKGGVSLQVWLPPGFPSAPAWVASP